LDEVFKLLLKIVKDWQLLLKNFFYYNKNRTLQSVKTLKLLIIVLNIKKRIHP